MPDNKCTYQNTSAGGNCKETICMDVNRVLDSCRDKDCFENVRVTLTDCSAEALEHVSAVRAIDAELVGASIGVSPVAFNRGFYQITVRYFVKVTAEGCIGTHPQMLEGIAVCEKNAILYGGEGNVHVFRSGLVPGSFCQPDTAAAQSDRMPSVICETVDPVLLGVKIQEENRFEGGCGCGCGCVIPDSVLSCLSGCLCGGQKERVLTVSLGFFSVLRIERQAQVLVSATEYNVPDKVCKTGTTEDPCALFSKMAFPVSEFNSKQCGDAGCGCGK